MISVYFMQIRDLTHGQIAAMASALSSEERIRLGRRTADASRVAAHFLLARLSDGKRVSYTAQGAPRVEGRAVSLTHSRGCAAIALSLSDRRIGIDAEDGVLRRERLSALRRRFLPDPFVEQALEDGAVTFYETVAKFDTDGALTVSFEKKPMTRVKFSDGTIPRRNAAPRTCQTSLCSEAPRDGQDARTHADTQRDELERFLRDWTRAEAVLKANGTGFSTDVPIAALANIAETATYRLPGEPIAMLSVARLFDPL